jgi:Protein of unknown function (DUF2589)
MAEVVSVRALELHELLGSTMVAVVQADALAAKATLEYVETVGFVAPAGEDGDAADETTAGGRLRMASFRYRKRDETNEVTDFVAEVPVLSLVPIPALQVKDATFSFAIKIDAITKATDGPAPAAAPAVQPGPTPRLVEWLQPTRTKLIARPAAASGARTEEIRSAHHMEVKVTMAQADVPVGLERIFDLMDQAIQDRKAPAE